MKLKPGNYRIGVLFFSILALALCMGPKICLAAGTDSALGVTLYKDTVYQYDLNGDGKMEELHYQVTEDEENYKTELKLYINNKLCLTKKDEGMSFRVQLFDLDTKDKYLDLFLCTTMESDCAKNGFFVRYNGKKLVDNVKFEIDKLAKDFNTYRYSIRQGDGDGTFNAIIDTPVFSNAIGCYYCYVPFQLKGKEIKRLPATTYTLTKGSRDYKYKAAKSFSVYAKAGSKEVVYKVKKGDELTFDKLYVSKSGKAYFRARNGKGEWGWIQSDQENLFADYPMWG